MAKLKNFKYRELAKRLRKLGFEEDKTRGKGSERVWYKKDQPGVFSTIKCHGDGDTVKTGTLHALMRRLGIDPKDLSD